MIRPRSVILAVFLAAYCSFTAEAAAPETPSVRLSLEWGSWYTIGPFENTGGEGFAKAYPPEKSVDLKAAYKGKNGQSVSWKRQSGFVDGKVIDFEPLFKPNMHVAVYLTRQVKASAACQVEVEMGSDDTISVWVNGKNVLAHKVARPCRLGDEYLRIPLKKGAFGPPVSPEKAKPTPATMGIKLSDYGSNLLACSFDTLISLQSSEGFWSDAISVFHSFLSPTGSEKLSKLVQDNPKLQPVIFTHYALAILQTQFGSRKDEWDMIHRKAKKWLRQQDVDEDKLGEFDSPVKIML